MENLVANSQATIVDITVENFQQIIIEASQDKLVLIDFWADWCEPCKDLMPILEKLAGEYSQHLILAKVDCEAQQEVAAQFGIRSLPTVMVVQNGQPVDGFAGVQPDKASKWSSFVCCYYGKCFLGFIIKFKPLNR